MIAMPSLSTALGIVQTLWRALLAPRSPRSDQLSADAQARLLAAETKRVRELWRRG